MNNEKKLNIIGLIIKIAIAAPALLTGLIVMGSGVNADSDKLEQAEFMDSFAFSAVINISYITIIAAVILVLLFFALLLISRPATAIKSVLGLVIAALFFFIAYLIGTADTVESLGVSGGVTATASELNFTHAGIITALTAIFICAILALALGPILKLIRNN
ncbi:MAG: hypothetical protein JJT77_05390 [Crocinitomicaceae bacterium]|nr:hypothetical protein [Crocinitomicaceae bacterium]